MSKLKDILISILQSFLIIVGVILTEKKRTGASLLNIVKAEFPTIIIIIIVTVVIQIIIQNRNK